MFPGDPVIIRSEADLKLVARQMRVAAPDQDQIEYTKTDEDLKLLAEAVRDPLFRQKHNSGRSIVFENGFYSLVMTKNENLEPEKYHWHLSMACFTPFGQISVPDDTAEKIAKVFFEDWISMPNPGRMPLAHFVGNI